MVHGELKRWISLSLRGHPGLGGCGMGSKALGSWFIRSVHGGQEPRRIALTPWTAPASTTLLTPQRLSPEGQSAGSD